MASDINYASWPRHVGRHINVGNQKQLFLDDGFLVERAEGIRYVMHQPVKHPHNPLIVPDKPWELQVQLYGSVLWDEEAQIYKMWYTNRTYKYGKDSAVLIAYATSEDGIKWTKPALNILPHEGSAKNNLLLDPGPGGSGGVCVLKTLDEREAKKKYKMLYKTIEEGGGSKVAFSPDGIHWTKHPTTVLPGVFDTFNVAVQDNDKYVAYVRVNQRPRKRHRALGRIESEDFIHWNTPTIVLKPDERDPEDTDIYTSAAFKYSEADYAYFMMPSLFDWRTGKLQVQLATSRDNANWNRAGNRDVFIPLGPPHSFESAEIMVGAPSVVKDQIHIYYHGSNRPHWNGMGRPFEEKSGIGLATLRLDGFISIDAGEKPSGGTITTVPIQFSGNHLEINADATWGEIRVEILNDTNEVIEGFDRLSCKPVIGDSVRHRVSWSDSDVRTLIGTTVKLRFYIFCARLYAFQFRTDITQHP